LTIQALYSLYLQYPTIQTDSRKIQKGDIYFALKGPNFNGNKFAVEALEKGAAYAVVDELFAEKNEKIILVEDVLTTLQLLAKYHRQQFTIPFIAITGSNGKTTTKELVNEVLSKKYKTYCTQGNLNNHIGIPLTILSIKQDAEIAIIEMGANHQKEIEGYCTYTLPTHGIITNCGKAHLEGFGGIQGVRKGKGELYNFLKENKGTIFLYDDYDYLKEMSHGIHNIITYGTKNGLITGTVINAAPFLQIQLHKHTENCIINSQLVGSYNLPNLLCAAAVGTYFNISLTHIKTAIESYTPNNSRSQLLSIGSNKIILDAYNANPTSMKAAIENFAAIDSHKKVVMIGGMMELGEESVKEHQQIVELLQQYHWQNVVLVGGDFANTKHPYIFLPNATAAKDWLNRQHFEDCYILIKGSRSMQMEKILA
jgi:UDP-N-acetylmuramoyl-tripeptide--D-alanyl-D-alanine ligase